MKALKVLIAVLLMSVAVPVGSETVGIINLMNGDSVNGKNFTVVFKGYGYAEGEQLTITVIIETLEGVKSESIHVVAK